MASAENQSEIIQYVPFKSFVHPSFWHTLTDLKLDVDKLDDNTKQIHGRFSYREDIGPVFEIDGTSFNREPSNEQCYQNITGTLINKNTIEEFKAIDKAALLNSVGEHLWAEISKNFWIMEPSVLLNFILISYADLKKYHYFYWFAFPAPSQPTLMLCERSRNISHDFNKKQLDTITEAFRWLEIDHRCFFVIIKTNNNVVINRLASVLMPEEMELSIDFSKVYFAFTDASNGVNPGWSLRLFMAALYDYYPQAACEEINCVGLRSTSGGTFENSLIFTIKGSENIQATDSSGWVGWERNDKGNFGPKLANMSASMDPLKLADASSDLNIRLMKWRLVPDIDVDAMKTTKCLLLGAGTLGCHVARDLLAWGFRHITFLDSGKVALSNPTRQVLFTYKDCLDGGRIKAEAAAENLKLILPTVETSAIVAHIPMPGHPIGESLVEETKANIELITEAIKAHDVIFLLLDTREARWLPTLIASHYDKITINAALGFDSYLVMRHGLGSCAPSIDLGVDTAVVPGGQLGCYFCNDVTAPGNSLKDRTLDQQCTVTRPGVAAIAGALAVEILVGLLQHTMRSRAPAVYNPKSVEEDDLIGTEGVLGAVPHSIRGFLHSYQTVIPTCTKFSQCVACSDLVLDKYKEEGMEFLFKVFNSGTYLEDITGLVDLHLAADLTEMVAISDEETE